MGITGVSAEWKTKVKAKKMNIRTQANETDRERERITASSLQTIGQTSPNAHEKATEYRRTHSQHGGTRILQMLSSERGGRLQS